MATAAAAPRRSGSRPNGLASCEVIRREYAAASLSSRGGLVEERGQVGPGALDGTFEGGDDHAAVGLRRIGGARGGGGGGAGGGEDDGLARQAAEDEADLAIDLDGIGGGLAGQARDR